MSQDRVNFMARVPHRFDIRECQEFFTLFARFEYSMKIVGIRRAKKSGAIEADWSELARRVDSPLSASNNPALKEACAYLLETPPKRQDLIKGEITWREVPAGKGSDSADLFTYICRVRNNIFHGGKFRGMQLADPERSSELMRHSRTVLHAVLDFIPELREAFHG